MIGPVKFVRMRRAWRKAQTIHALEHENKQVTTMPCKAVDHTWWPDGSVDRYGSMFDSDERRHFLEAGGANRRWLR